MALTTEKKAELVSKYKGKPGSLIPLLQDIQIEENYLSRESMKFVAENFDVKLAEIIGVATFYSMFRLKPYGKNVIRVCEGTACHVKKSTEIVEYLEKELNLDHNKKTTDDLLFTLEEVNCLGACGIAPVVVVNGEVHPSMTVKKMEVLIHGMMKGENTNAK